MNRVNWEEEMQNSDRIYTDEFLLDEIKNLKSRLDELEKKLTSDGK